MTREQAINYLYSSGFSEEQVEEIVKAFEPTIKDDLAVSSELDKNSKKLEKDFGEPDCISRAERSNKLKHFITCLKCEVSGKCCDDNCSTQYDAGNMGEIIENLEAISRALEQEPKTGHWIDDEFGSKCSCCGIHTHLDKFDRPMKFKHCSMCGARMVEPQESEDKK